MKNNLFFLLIFCSLFTSAQEELSSNILKPLEAYDGASAPYFHEIVDIVELDDGFIYINNVRAEDFQPELNFLESYIKKTDPFLNIIDSVDTQTLGLEIPGLILWGLTQDHQNDSLLHIWGGAENNSLPNGRMTDFYVLHTDLNLEILSIDSFSYRESFRISPPTVNRQGNVTVSLRSYVESDSLPYSRSYVEFNTQGEIINEESIFSNTTSGSGLSPQIAQLPDHSYLSIIGGVNVVKYYDELLSPTSSEEYADRLFYYCEPFLNTVTIDSTIYFGAGCEKTITENPNIPWSPIVESQYVERIFRYQNSEISESFEVAPFPLPEGSPGISSGYAPNLNTLKFNFDALYSDRIYTSAYYDNYFVNYITHNLMLHASDENGNLRWSKHFSHPTKSYETYRVKALRDGGVLLLAEFNNRNPDISIEKDVVAIRFDENGNEYTGEITSVADLDIPTLILYPNPAEDQLHVQVESGRPIKELIVYGLDGKQLIHQISRANAIDLNLLTKGMYILVASFSDGTVVREKFIKQ